ncbi:MAG: TVP38/TMEM64 family protein [Mogibacterium sp.]|nr:TVP38/TMEM64 family protein [Mogibacterium sp.]
MGYSQKTDESNNKARTSAIIKLILLAFIIIGVPLILYLNYRDTLFNTAWLRQLPTFLQQYKRTAFLILVGLQVLQVIICIVPGQPIQFAASYMFGVLQGYLISIAGAVIGATISFYISRVLGKDAIHVLFGEEKIENYRRKLNSGKGLMAVLLIYLIPGIPKDLVAYAAGVSEMRFRAFILISTIGRSPGMLGSLLLGHFFSSGNYTAIAVLAVLTAVILIVCAIKRKDLIAILDRLEEKVDKEETNTKESREEQ